MLLKEQKRFCTVILHRAELFFHDRLKGGGAFLRCPKGTAVSCTRIYEAQVWVADSDDVPGLVTEADTSEQLIKKLQILIPELLEVNGLIEEWKETDIPLYL